MDDCGKGSIMCGGLADVKTISARRNGGHVTLSACRRTFCDHRLHGATTLASFRGVRLFELTDTWGSDSGGFPTRHSEAHGESDRGDRPGCGNGGDDAGGAARAEG